MGLCSTAALTTRNLCRMRVGGSSDAQIAKKLAFTHTQDGSNRFKQAWAKSTCRKAQFRDPIVWLLVWPGFISKALQRQLANLMDLETIQTFNLHRRSV